MKKTIAMPVLSFIVVSLLIFGCGGRYSDVKEVNEEYISLIDDYIADIDKAENAGDAAEAINKFADGMEKLWPKMLSLGEKYPELKDESKLPDDIRKLNRKVEETSKKMGAAMVKLIPYMMNGDVIKAQKRLGALMLTKYNTK